MIYLLFAGRWKIVTYFHSRFWPWQNCIRPKSDQINCSCYSMALTNIVWRDWSGTLAVSPLLITSTSRNLGMLRRVEHKWNFLILWHCVTEMFVLEFRDQIWERSWIIKRQLKTWLFSQCMSTKTSIFCRSDLVSTGLTRVWDFQQDCSKLGNAWSIQGLPTRLFQGLQPTMLRFPGDTSPLHPLFIQSSFPCHQSSGTNPQ